MPPINQNDTDEDIPFVKSAGKDGKKNASEPKSPEPPASPVSQNGTESGSSKSDKSAEQKDSAKKEGQKDDLAAGSERVPQWLVMNFQIPYYEPSMGILSAAKDDGPGYSLVFYFYLRPSAKKALQKSGGSNSIKLLRSFFAGPDESDGVRKRLKAIPKIVNPEDLSLNMATRPLVNNYNAKPFMTGPRCHTFYRGPDYLECTVDVHKFCWAARKGAWSMFDLVDKMIVDFGVVVEATEDAEMPEQVLACVRLSRIECSAAKTLDQWLARAAEKAKKDAEAKDKQPQSKSSDKTNDSDKTANNSSSNSNSINANAQSKSAGSEKTPTKNILDTSWML
jgi:hypothetical protein